MESYFIMNFEEKRIFLPFLFFFFCGGGEVDWIGLKTYVIAGTVEAEPSIGVCIPSQTRFVVRISG